MGLALIPFGTNPDDMAPVRPSCKSDEPACLLRRLSQMLYEKSGAMWYWRVLWHIDGGKLLLKLNRLLRPEISEGSAIS